MKKIIKKFCLFLGHIFKFIDKIIITPVMKLFLKISDLFSSNNRTLERLFANKQFLIIISLVLAVIAFAVIEQNSNALVSSAEMLYNQPVKAIYNEEAYVIEGLPETVDVVLIGRRSNIYLAKQLSGSDEITVDLRELSVGTHRVNLKYRQRVTSVEYKLDPSVVTVVVYDKISETREVTAEILHRDKLDSKKDISNISLDQTEVTIKGSEKELAQVAYVKALVDLEKLPKDTPVGETKLSDNTLIAYDTNGEMVDVEILPKTIGASLTVTSTSKSVPIRVIPDGDLAVGYAIESTTTNVSNVTIYGDEELLQKVEYIPVVVDVDGLSTDKEFNVNLEKPTGVRDMSEKSVTVKLKVGEQAQKEVTNVQVHTINLANGLKVTAGSASDSVVSVIVKGSKEVLDEIDASKIVANVDLSKYTTPGEYEVDVTVTGEDLRVSYESKTKKIKVRIYE